MSLNLKRKRGSPLSSLTPTQNLSASTSNATTPCIPKSRRCLFELSNRKRKQASSLQTETLNREPSMTTTPTPCTKGLLSSTASVTATPSSSEALSSESSGILQQVPEQPLFAFTAQRANMKRKANDKKCDGKKFRKMVSDLSVSSDEQSPKQISFHSVSQNPSPSLICQGTFHQGSHSSFHYPGQQCSAIALCALMYSSVRAVDSWDASNVDDILLIGDKIHFDQLCHLKKDPNEDQKLTLDEVPNGVTMLNYTFSNDNREIVAGTIKEKDEPGNDFATLEDAFTKCENENATGLVLRILDYCVACIINSSAWYLIDSHARNSEGMTDERGTAVALKFMSSSDLANHVRRFVTNQRTLSRDTDLSFEALIVKVTRAQCKESEVSVVPKIKLFSLTSSHGTCEIFTTSLCRLEEERKIDDNTIDFVVLHSVDLFLDEDVRDNLFVFNSCFYAKIKQNFNSKSTRNWTKTVNIFEKDFVIIPVCHNDHWILIIIKMVIPVVSVMVLDSANAERVPRENVERTIKRYLEDEWCAKRSSQQDSIQQEFHYPVVPQQTNDTDCGVFLMKNLEEFLKCYPVAGAAWQKWRPVYGQKDVVALRKQIKFLIQKFSYEARQ